VSPLKTQWPEALAAAKPTAGTVCTAGKTSTALPPTWSTSPTAMETKRMSGVSTLGMAEKSGQIRLLKICTLSAAMVPGRAWTCSGAAPLAMRRAATASSMRGSAAT
jgi:hypothetical protein